MSENTLNLKDCLDFYILSGVDETCGDEPYTCMKPVPEEKIEIAKNKIPYSAVAGIESVKSAAALCQNISSMEELKRIVENFDGCALKYNAKNTVIGDGNPKAKIMFIGEAPGAEEDMIGKAFVGRSGQLLNKILAAIGLDREHCYICNILPWRPPGNRAPSDAEIAICLPFLKKQIEIVKPNYIFTLGAVAANSLLEISETVSKLRGKWMDYTADDGRNIKVMVGYHPAYLLRTPAQKAKMWADVLRLKNEIDKNN